MCGGFFVRGFENLDKDDVEDLLLSCRDAMGIEAVTASVRVMSPTGTSDTPCVGAGIDADILFFGHLWISMPMELV